MFQVNKLVLLLALTIGVFLSQNAESQTVSRVEIVKYGHVRNEVVSVLPEPGTPGNVKYQSRAIFLNQTDRVPGQLNDGFSIYYIMHGAPIGGEVDIRAVYHAPEPGVKDPQSGVAHRVMPYTFKHKIGDQNRVGWGFHKASDIVHGKWKVDVYMNGIMQISKEFVVFNPR